MRQRGREDRLGHDLLREGRFALGQLVMTPGVKEAVAPSEMMRAVRRHARGDWGDIKREDQASNDRAVKEGDRLLSSYTTKAGTVFWVITEADRSATTLLLPDEY